MIFIERAVPRAYKIYAAGSPAMILDEHGVIGFECSTLIGEADHDLPCQDLLTKWASCRAVSAPFGLIEGMNMIADD